MAKPSGEIIETPITANFREVSRFYSILSRLMEQGRGWLIQHSRQQIQDILTRRLVDAAQDVIISEPDCFTTDGIIVSALVEGGEVIQPLDERILGRLTAEDVLDPVTQEVIVKAHEELEEKSFVRQLLRRGIDHVKIRSVLMPISMGYVPNATAEI